MLPMPCTTTPRAGLARAIVCLLLGLLAGGCANPRQAVDFATAEAARGDLKVAVLPLENLTNHPSAGVIVAELLAAEIYHRRVFSLQENAAVRRTLLERDMEPAEASRLASPVELASQLQVDAVLVGSVSEFGYQHGLHEEPVVGINLRLVDGREGRVLWAASHSASGTGVLVRDSLNAAAQRVVRTMIDNLLSTRRAPSG